MGVIKRLPPPLISKLAAGEVIERPASVVKELMENSIDALSKKIVIRVEEGGKKTIEVADDGIGMDEDDALAALEEYSTSKISSSEDLYSIETLGFRGEALHAISSVSRLTLFTSQKETGTEVKVEGGVIKSVRKKPRSKGTTVLVKDLFFNLPARRRFLRSNSVELAHIIQTAKEYALAFCDIHIVLKDKERVLFNLFPCELIERAASVWDVNTENLIKLQEEKDDVRLFGVISSFNISRKDPGGEVIFVNKRPIRDRYLMAAIKDAYSPYLTKGEYPLVAIFIDLFPSEVDVNVHPSKKEVKFKKPFIVYQLLKDSIRGCLESQIPKVYFSDASFRLYKPYRIFDEKEKIDIEFLGEFSGLYMLFESKEHGLLVVDKHAFHERILFDRIYENLSKTPQTQRLLFPVKFSLQPELRERLEEELSQLRQIGFRIVLNKDGSCKIEAVPSWLEEDPEAFLIAFLSEEAELSIREKIARVACSMAKKSGDYLSSFDVSEVIEVLRNKGVNITCPHGRPAVVCLSRDWWDRLFKRRV